MVDAEKPPQLPKSATTKHVIAEKVSGTVKWFNVKSGYGFINSYYKEQSEKVSSFCGDGEAVEFSVVEGDKGYEAAFVTGPDGVPVKGSPYAAEKRRGYRQFQPNRQQGGGRGGEGGGPRRGGMGGRITFQPFLPVGVVGAKVAGEGAEGVQPQHRYFRNNTRGGRRGGRTQGNNGEPIPEGSGRGGGGRGGGGWSKLVNRRQRPQRGQGKPSDGQNKDPQDKQLADNSYGASNENDECWGGKYNSPQAGTAKEIHNTTTQSQA